MYPGSSYTEKHHIAIELNVLYSVEVIRNSVEPKWPIIGGNKKRFTQAAVGCYSNRGIAKAVARARGKSLRLCRVNLCLM